MVERQGSDGRPDGGGGVPRVSQKGFLKWGWFAGRTGFIAKRGCLVAKVELAVVRVSGALCARAVRVTVLTPGGHFLSLPSLTLCQKSGLAAPRKPLMASKRSNLLVIAPPMKISLMPPFQDP